METGVSQSSNDLLKEYCNQLKQENGLNNRILLVKGPQLNLGSFEPEVAKNKCYYAYPPTGLQYLSEAAGNRGLEIKILDLNYEFLREINNNEKGDWLSVLEKNLFGFNPSVVGVSNLFTIDTPGFLRILEYLKDKKKIVIAGGQNATYEGESLLQGDLCHFVCKRESENKLNFLLDHLFEDKKTPPTPQILFKYKGGIHETEGEPDFVHMKGNLIETYKQIPIEEYCSVGSLSPYSRMAGVDKPFATLSFMRGCHGNCKFCGVVDFTCGTLRKREAKDFLDELEYLVNERGVRFFELLDDDFTADKDAALEVLEGMIDRKINVRWASNNGIIASTLNESLLEKMRDSGCMGFKIGVESGNPQILKRIHKPGMLNSFMRFSGLAQNFPEMFIADNYILGFPEETFAQILDSFDFSIKMKLDWSNYSVYQHNVGYFGNEEERKNRKTNIIEDFSPSKDMLQGKIDYHEGLYAGKDIFRIPPDSVPSREQLKHIWFAFNLMRNFVFNKNLSADSEGSIQKYLSWVKTLEGRYPTHPYINLFTSAGESIIGDYRAARDSHKKMLKNLEDPYWKKKFGEFELNDIVSAFPTTPSESLQAINLLREKYQSWRI